MAATNPDDPPPVQGIHSKPTGLFSDEDFLKAAKQVQNPNFEGWEFFVEAMGVKMYRKYSEVHERRDPPCMIDACSLPYKCFWGFRVSDEYILTFKGGKCSSL